jgi:hypothetical protein
VYLGLEQHPRASIYASSASLLLQTNHQATLNPNLHVTGEAVEGEKTYYIKSEATVRAALPPRTSMRSRELRDCRL